MTAGPPGVFRRIAGALAPARGRQDIVWQPEGRPYPRLAAFEPRHLAGRGGLYLLWHLGVRPQWLRAAFAKDLAAAAVLLAKTPEIVAFAPHDGPFLSWGFCDIGEAPGRVNFLAACLAPVMQDVVLGCDVAVDPAVPAIPCALPAGTKDIRTAFTPHADRV